MGVNHNLRVRAWTKRRIDIRGEQMRVLVVDDYPLAAEALAMALTLENMVCRTAFSGAEAIAIGVVWIPHAIIMDISMPGCSGIDAARALRDDHRTSHVSIFAFTALDESDVLGNVTGSEFDGYCQKGQPPRSLVALLTR